MKIIQKILLVNVAMVIAQCPSNECWTYDSTGNACILKATSSVCPYTLDCASAGISLEYDSTKLFGPAADTIADFGAAEASCITKDTNGRFKWETDLSNCGTTIAMETGHIVFRKTLAIGQASDGMDVGGTTIYTDNVGGAVSITFTCKYSATAQATSTAITIAEARDITADVTEQTGSFDTGLSLKFYTDLNYNIEQTSASTIGDIVYPMVSWEVTSLSTKIGYYLKTCRVEDVSAGAGTGLEILSESCYANAVSAQPEGDAATNKFVTQRSQFSYHSFSYDTSATDTQKLICDVEFCVISSGLPACNVPIITADAGTCPTTEGFSYTPKGTAD